MRSLSCGPGNRLLMTTPSFAASRAAPATKPVSPLRAAVDNPNSATGDLTVAEVMLTIRPQPRRIIPGSTLLISRIGVSILALMAPSQAS